MPITNEIEEFARRVKKALAARDIPCLALDALTDFFETLFFASLKTEELRPVRFQVVFIDSRMPDPAPPEYPPEHRWRSFPLGQRIELTTSSVVKLASASDARASALPVEADRHGRR